MVLPCWRGGSDWDNQESTLSSRDLSSDNEVIKTTFGQRSTLPLKPTRTLLVQANQFVVLHYAVVVLVLLVVLPVMANTSRAPKQWSLTKTETITSFESWRQNLTYILSLDPSFAPFLVNGVVWERKSRASPLRGLQSDPETVPEPRRCIAEQKVAQLELMLGQIANYCPIISHNTIVKNATSLNGIWQSIRMHFGFHSTGANFIDFDDIRMLPDERPEDLFQ